MTITATLLGAAPHTGASISVTIANSSDLIALAITGSGAPTSISDTNSRVTWQGSATKTYAGAVHQCTIWYGISSSTGTTTINVTGGTTSDLWPWELHESVAGGTWGVVTSGTLDTTNASTLLFPSLSTAATPADQAYVGGMAFNSSASTFNAPGTGVWSDDINGNGDLSCAGTSLNTSTAYQPNDTGGTDSTSSVAAIFSSTPSGGGATATPQPLVVPSLAAQQGSRW